jgi:hypothetical protein
MMLVDRLIATAHTHGEIESPVDEKASSNRNSDKGIRRSPNQVLNHFSIGSGDNSIAPLVSVAQTSLVQLTSVTKFHSKSQPRSAESGRETSR